MPDQFNTTTPPKKLWHVAKTRPRAEAKAAFHLERQGFEVYLPRFLRRVRHARKTSWQPRPLFPSYLFVALYSAQQRWRAINSTLGVDHLICDNNGPVPVPHGIVENIRSEEDERGLLMTGSKVSFKKDTEVEIMAGAFADHIGRFICATDDERGLILLTLLGRQVTAEIKLGSITAHA